MKVQTSSQCSACILSVQTQQCTTTTTTITTAAAAAAAAGAAATTTTTTKQLPNVDMHEESLSMC